MPERLAADISADLREYGKLLPARTELVYLLGEAADKLDGLIALLAQAETDRDEAGATVERVRELHSPRPGWEREWKDPAEALANGWVTCAGCHHPGGTTYLLKDCPTLRALDGEPVREVADA